MTLLTSETISQTRERRSRTEPDAPSKTSNSETAFALSAGEAFNVPQRPLASAGEPQNVIHQLRIYEIFDSNKKGYHDRFRDHAMRIMAKYDFKIVATSESKKDNRTEFIYLLEWPRQGNHDRSLGKIPA
jgi:hypothetical protein